jgi:hypothetical protein|tara:strand:- start:14433 stop:14852 length:420 start_codon:yes stop_codon:yes gene_type:complete
MRALLPTDHLLRPRELHPRVRTAADYRTQQRIAIEQKMQEFPGLNWERPWRHIGAGVVKVSDSQWQIVCICGNYPLYDPEWQLACCYSCGAIYEQAPPEEWREIERVLVARPKLGMRHWLPGETLADLVAENLAHGDPT